MPSIIVPVSEKFREETARHLAWVNWSELSREESRMKLIFDGFLKTGKLSEEDSKFCEETDWHPVDWLPLREEFIREIKRIEKGKYSKPMNLEELKKWFEEL